MTMQQTIDRLSRSTPALIATLALVVVASCATLPPAGQRSVSRAIPPNVLTRLARLLEPDLVRHPGRSGLLLLDSGLDAFVARALALPRNSFRLELESADGKGDPVPVSRTSECC